MEKSVRIGLNSYPCSCQTGLGNLAARFWRKLPFAARLVFTHPRFSTRCNMKLDAPVTVLSRRPNVEQIDRWLATVDTVVCLERPMPMDLLPRRAKDLGKRLVLIVMPEWLPPGLPFLPHFDRFVTFTNQGAEHCRKIGLGERTVQVQCPLDLDEFPFRERTAVKSVVYLDGWGGVHERKGWPEVQELLRREPGRVRVKSQRGLPGAEPAAERPADLYADADCVLVPGRFDGLGLSVLEGLASGCIVMATDAEPYRQFIDDAYYDWNGYTALPIAELVSVKVWGQQWPCAKVCVDSMSRVIGELRKLPVDLVVELSRAGRAYIEREHGEAAWGKLWEAICGVH